MEARQALASPNAAATPGRARSGVPEAMPAAEPACVAPPASGRWAYGAALALGLAYVAVLFPLGTLWPLHPLGVWLAGDPAQSVIGQRYFLGEGWGWPLLYARQLGWPQGVNVALTDSIPLALLPLKLLRRALPPGFFVVNGWMALAWALQPVGFVWAWRSLRQRGTLPCLAGAALSLCMPTLLVRVGHTALTTHVELLVGIAAYGVLIGRPSPARWGAAWVLLAAALLTHPYLLAMDAALLAAVPLGLALRRDRRWRGAALGFACCLVAVAALAGLLHYGGASPGQYGLYAMNVASPFTPQHSALFGDREWDATGGQGFEGDQYLGAGLLLLIAAAGLALLRGRVRLPWRAHGGLLLVAAGLTLYAISLQPTLGPWRWMMLRRVPELLEQFRATGRFFWPVAYLLLLGSLAALRAWPRRIGLVLLAAAVVLQVADTQAARAKLYAALRHAPPAPEFAAQLRPILARHDSLTIWPPYGCGADQEGPDFLPTLLLASERRLRVNTMFYARTATPAECDLTHVLSAPLAPGELRLIMPPATQLASTAIPHEAACGVMGHLVLCSAVPGALAGLAPPGVQPLLPGESIGVPGFADRLLTITGWEVPGPQGMWTVAPLAMLRLPVRVAPGQAVRLVLSGLTIAPAQGARQSVTAEAAGVSVTAAPPEFTLTRLALDIPAGPARQDLDVTIRVAQPARPSERGWGSQDTRTLGFNLQSVALEAEP